MQRRKLLTLTVLAALMSVPVSAAGARPLGDLAIEQPGRFINDFAREIRDLAVATLQLVLPIHAEGDPWGLRDEDTPPSTAESGEALSLEGSAIHAEGDPWG